MKIYIVKSSRGGYEDYHEWNEKAFYKKEDAEKYTKELDKEYNYKPEFITDSFEKAYRDAEYEAPDWPDYEEPISYNSEEYQKYLEDNLEAECNFTINYLKDKGFEVTKEMLDTYENWISYQYDKYYPCKIEELELI